MNCRYIKNPQTTGFQSLTEIYPFSVDFIGSRYVPVASLSGSPLRLRVAMDPVTQLSVSDGDQTFRTQIVVVSGGVEASKVHVIVHIDVLGIESYDQIYAYHIICACGQI